MSFLKYIVVLSLSSFLIIHALAMFNENEVPTIKKRLSNDALIRLIMRNQHSMFTSKRDEKRADFDRRSVDDDFSNCFLSPVQCMLPRSRR
ncbi:hypothetical protein RB195_022659 [Necator americanus]|uniref:Uncharacterized protein n=3 Tax=Necator americanus TaxID=51031 RepID=W2TY09_NECAM|nr:hypothetical protein NECAME_16575 [Necator americanus]ETN85931.1 hypothetical protein NECAME_16575 [Necator americanus]